MISQLMQQPPFFLENCCIEHKRHDERDPGLFREEFRCTELLRLCSKTYCCYDLISNKVQIQPQKFKQKNVKRL